ncbi:MAG: hypothetical protein C3F10_07200 [Dehalococcoidia bacterium]|nr:hypothetical protein [Dehalococcoidia bacterium]PWB44989.1 MAG: hypothetical protein C3F10_07200 [Dehalococcoidia bacterium]
MSFEKTRAGRWKSLRSGWRIDARGRDCFALIDPAGRIAGQEKTLEDAMATVRREEEATVGTS